MEDAASFKDIQNLLENVEKEEESKSWRKYARLVLPHVGLVIFVCLYALLGAWIFYSIESPHEDRLKVHGIRRVQELRRQLVRDMLGTETGLGRLGWMAGTRRHWRKFGEDLFRSYKEQYVRYEDIRPIGSGTATQQIAPQQQQLADPRLRRHFSKSRSQGKMWTPSSALFFAATTIATIGYGNIVPMTNHGRIACIIFALFGAPLAIITIGDLGKFLSECTIWMYRHSKDKWRLCRFRLRQYWLARKKRRRRRLKENLVSEEEADMEMGEANGRGHEVLRRRKVTADGVEQKKQQRMAEEAAEKRRLNDWEAQEKSDEVPVLVVFAILLLYIAMGGVLFAVLESWTYMDAFYYCFVSLTTIGFGDLVPDRHDYIVLMLLYLGFGLAVTTMCIDLVGVQYIQKIHYFGRKFKGTDIMQILRRKRMLERRIAMGEGKELLEFVIKQEMEALNPMHQQRSYVQPVMHLASQLQEKPVHEEEKISLRSEQEIIWPLEEAFVQDFLPTNELALVKELEVPEVMEPPAPLPRRLSSPTITPSSESERSIMYNRLTSGRADSWAESGPSLSLKNSPLSTEPSVRQREDLYSNYRSPQPSLTSFAFSFPMPSPDLWKIAEEARGSRRLASCPQLPPGPPSSIIDFPVSSPPAPRLWRKWRSIGCPARAFHELLRLSKRSVVVVLPHQSLSRRFSRAPDCWEFSPAADAQGTSAASCWGERGEREEEADHRDLRVGEEEAHVSIHNSDVLQRRVSFFEHRAQILQAPKYHPRFIGQPVWFYRRRRSLHQQQQQQEMGDSGGQSLVHLDDQQQQQQQSTSDSSSAFPLLPRPLPVLESYQPVLKRKRRERLARRIDPLNRLDWLTLSPRIAVTEEGVPATMAEISERARELLEIRELPKQLASEHPVYQHLAELEQVESNTYSFEPAPSGTLSSRLLSQQLAPRHSWESLAFGLRAARRWKEAASKRKQMPVGSTGLQGGQWPFNLKGMAAASPKATTRRAQPSPRRMSLGGVMLTTPRLPSPQESAQQQQGQWRAIMLGLRSAIVQQGSPRPQRQQTVDAPAGIDRKAATTAAAMVSDRLRRESASTSGQPQKPQQKRTSLLPAKVPTAAGRQMSLGGIAGGKEGSLARRSPGLAKSPSLTPATKSPTPPVSSSASLAPLQGPSKSSYSSAASTSSMASSTASTTTSTKGKTTSKEAARTAKTAAAISKKAAADKEAQQLQQQQQQERRTGPRGQRKK